MTKILATSIAKGGVGKTTVSGNLAVALAQKGLSVLVIDFDPQGNLTSAFGLEGQDLSPFGTSADLLYSPIRRPITECVIPDVVPGVDVIRSSEQDLYIADDDLRRGLAGESKLARALRTVDGVWNWIILDLPPALKGPLVVNAFVAATHVISPVTPSGWAAKGAARVKAAVEEVRLEELGSPEYLGVLWNRVVPNRSSQALIMEEMARIGTIPILTSQIPNRVAAEDAEVLGLPAATEPDSDLGLAFADLAGELLYLTGESSENTRTLWRERQDARKAEQKVKAEKGGKKKRKKKRDVA